MQGCLAGPSFSMLCLQALPMFAKGRCHSIHVKIWHPVTRPPSATVAHATMTPHAANQPNPVAVDSADSAAAIVSMVNIKIPSQFQITAAVIL